MTRKVSFFLLKMHVEFQYGNLYLVFGTLMIPILLLFTFKIWNLKKYCNGNIDFIVLHLRMISCKGNYTVRRVKKVIFSCYIILFLQANKAIHLGDILSLTTFFNLQLFTPFSLKYTSLSYNIRFSITGCK